MKPWQSFKTNFYRPSWWTNEVIPHVLNSTKGKITEVYTKATYDPSDPVCRLMEEDWDNLVILDGCRYDLFESVNTLPGEPGARTSLGSATPEFLERNFEGTTHHDTVYVTANPQLAASDVDFSTVFHDVVDVWQEDWNEEHRTVMPGAMAEATLEAYERYPDKRLVSHFVQPHYPFVGKSGDEIGNHSGNEASVRDAMGKEPERDFRTVWKMVAQGDVSIDLVEKAYRENLELTLPHVSALLDAFEGRTVVTSDHGNHLGERPVPFLPPLYSHPPDVYTDKLRRVPWLVCESGERKTVTAEAPVKSTDGPSEDVEDRLTDLGYV